MISPTDCLQEKVASWLRFSSTIQWASAVVSSPQRPSHAALPNVICPEPAGEPQSPVWLGTTSSMDCARPMSRERLITLGRPNPREEI